MLKRLKNGLLKAPSRRKATLCQMIISWIDQGSLIVNGLLLLPMYYKFLGMENYGYWLATGGILLWISMLDMVAITGQRAASAYAKKNYLECVQYYWTGMLFNVIIAIPLLTLGCLLGYAVPKWLSVPDAIAKELSFAFNIGVVATFVLYFASTGTTFLAALQRPVTIALTRPFAAVAQIAIIVYGLKSGWGLIAIPLGLLARNVIIGMQSISYSAFLALLLVPRVAPSLLAFKDYCKNGPSVMLNIISNGLSQKFQPTLITLFVGAGSAAAFDATLRVGMLVNMVSSRMALAAFPSLSHLFGSESSLRIRELLRNFMMMTLVVSVVGLGGYVALNKSFVILWLGESAFAGQSVTVIAAIWLLLSSLANFIFYAHLGHGAINRSMLIRVAGTVVQLILSVLLLKFSSIGLVSLPLASIAGVLVMIVLNYTGFSDKLRAVFPGAIYFLKCNLVAFTVIFMSSLLPTFWVPEGWFSFVVTGVLYACLAGLLLLLAFRRNLLPMMRDKLGRFNLIARARY